MRIFYLYLSLQIPHNTTSFHKIFTQFQHSTLLSANFFLTFGNKGINISSSDRNKQR